MSILSELKGILSSLEIPIETGVFSDTPPDEYLVLTPITDELNYFADDFPSVRSIGSQNFTFYKIKLHTKKKSDYRVTSEV